MNERMPWENGVLNIAKCTEPGYYLIGSNELFGSLNDIRRYVIENFPFGDDFRLADITSESQKRIGIMVVLALPNESKP